MRAEILIAHGRLQLLTPIYLKPDAPSHYHIDVPDDAIEAPRDWLPDEFRLDGQVVFQSQRPNASPDSLQDRFNQILGKLAKTRPGASIGDDYQSLQDALEERYFGR